MSWKLQLITHNFSADSLGEFGAEFHNAGVLVGRGVELDIVLNFFLQLLGAFGTGNQYDTSLNDLTSDLIGGSADTALQNIGQLHDGGFDLEGSDALFQYCDDTTGILLIVKYLFSLSKHALAPPLRHTATAAAGL